MIIIDDPKNDLNYQDDDETTAIATERGQSTRSRAPSSEISILTVNDRSPNTISTHTSKEKGKGKRLERSKPSSSEDQHKSIQDAHNKIQERTTYTSKRFSHIDTNGNQHKELIFGANEFDKIILLVAEREI
ncbi:hypothetical protein T440DRAFT_477938 [Plenodomus tracheiphilus IPT5]|uniref:Uncharacterized protein n=1 Tax=Plenodomus tracheiphilus IPT5 TaxID=1408161 RepID=A0A6A7B8N4_9PLEO|nr:hypothetical protein T440DRAFT_477938 [Plenodomus tracheiphilus IPT5]